jgi:adenosylcobinamide-GDP ribazoletransferase
VAALAGLGEAGRLVDLPSADWPLIGLASLNFDAALVCLTIVAAHVCSRAAPLVLIATLPHVGDSATSKSKPLADQINAKGLFVGIFWIFPLIVSVIWLKLAIYFVVPIVLMLLALIYMWRLFARRLQGFTGDCLGATQQVCEVAFYLGALAALGGVGGAGGALGLG